METPHKYIFIDEAGFNLRGRSIIDQCAVVEISSWQVDSAALSNWTDLHHHENLEPYNVDHFLTLTAFTMLS